MTESGERYNIPAPVVVLIIGVRWRASPAAN
jgi:hypothetical protein